MASWCKNLLALSRVEIASIGYMIISAIKLPKPVTSATLPKLIKKNTCNNQMVEIMVHAIFIIIENINNYN